MKKNEKKVYLIRIVAFVILFSLQFYGISIVFKNKNMGNVQYNFKQERKGSVEAVFVGSSHVFNAIDTEILEDEYGIYTYNLASSSQTLPISYYAVQEAIELQHPKVIVVEVCYIYLDTKTRSAGNSHAFFDDMPLCRAKIEGINDLFPKEERLSYYIPFMLHHARWKELTAEDFKSRRDFRRGFQLNTENTSFDDFLIYDKDQTFPIEEVAEIYLRKIIQVCKDSDTTLVLFATPFYANEDDVIKDGMEKVQRQLNTVGIIANEEQVDYLNYFHLLDEISFDFQSDMANQEHVNASGSRKVTEYMGKYLQQHILW